MRVCAYYLFSSRGERVYLFECERELNLSNNRRTTLANLGGAAQAFLVGASV